jgi:hypothetical protein
MCWLLPATMRVALHLDAVGESDLSKQIKEPAGATHHLLRQRAARVTVPCFRAAPAPEWSVALLLARRRRVIARPGSGRKTSLFPDDSREIEHRPPASTTGRQRARHGRH